MKLSAEGIQWAGRLNAIFTHMQKVSAVMFERAMFHTPIYQALSNDGFKSFCQSRPEFSGQEARVEAPIRFALGYAQCVFLGTAIELSLLHLYVNSVQIYEDVFPGEMPKLLSLKTRVESGRKRTAFNDWLALPREDRAIQMKKIPFSDMPSAQKFFSDIYGPGCFESAWTPSGYRDLQLLLQAVQTRRNGIVHRGGEEANGTEIAISAADLSQGFQDARQVMASCRGLSQFLLNWWMGAINKKFAI